MVLVSYSPDGIEFMVINSTILNLVEFITLGKPMLSDKIIKMPKVL
jgi:hypothetical protein